MPVGAEAGLRELQREVEAIHQMFPDLRSEVASAGSSVPIAQRNRRRGRMSAAQRKAVGERMKKYWAARRAAANGAMASKDSPSSDTAKALSEKSADGKTHEGPSEAWRTEDVRCCEEAHFRRAKAVGLSKGAPPANERPRRQQTSLRTRMDQLRWQSGKRLRQN